MKDQHPDIDQLLLWEANELAPADAARMTAHVSACHTCQAAADKLGHLRRVLSTAGAGRPSAAAREAVFRAFRKQAGPPPGLRSLVAQLAFNSRTMAPARGLRASLAATPQLLYTTPEMDLALTIHETGENALTVSGQVLWAADPPAGPVQFLLIEDELVVAQAVASVLGEFALADVVPGTYQVVLLTPDLRIEVPEVTL
jgi:anti-sigma factor RsiW